MVGTETRLTDYSLIHDLLLLILTFELVHSHVKKKVKRVRVIYYLERFIS